MNVASGMRQWITSFIGWRIPLTSGRPLEKGEINGVGIFWHLGFKINISTTCCPSSLYKGQQGRRRGYRGEGKFSSCWQEECFGQKGEIHLTLLQASGNRYYWHKGQGQHLPACLVPLCQNWLMLWLQHCFFESPGVDSTLKNGQNKILWIRECSRN